MYNKKYLILFLTVISFIVISCASLQDVKPTITTGVFGRIWKEGNLDVSRNIEGQAIERTIRFYEITNLKQGSGFKSINKKFIAETTSNKAGYFQCKLKPGIYSCFTFEPYSTLFDNFTINAGTKVIEVKEGEVTNLNIKIYYQSPLEL